MRLYEVFKRPKGGTAVDNVYLGVFACHDEREAQAEAANLEFGPYLDTAALWDVAATLWDGRRPPHGRNHD